jgi:hypothetical protein
MNILKTQPIENTPPNNYCLSATTTSLVDSLTKRLGKPWRMVPLR